MPLIFTPAEHQLVERVSSEFTAEAKLPDFINSDVMPLKKKIIPMRIITRHYATVKKNFILSFSMFLNVHKAFHNFTATLLWDRTFQVRKATCHVSPLHVNAEDNTIGVAFFTFVGTGEKGSSLHFPDYWWNFYSRSQNLVPACLDLITFIITLQRFIWAS